MDTALADFVRRLPKVELRLHLEGAVSAAAFEALAARSGAALDGLSASWLDEGTEAARRAGRSTEIDAPTATHFPSQDRTHPERIPA